MELLVKKDEGFSENLWEESLEMMLDLLTTKEIYKIFESKGVLNLSFLGKIKESNTFWSWMS